MPDWRQMSLADRVAWVIGSGLGTGFAPVAPGTVGSAVAGLILYVVSALLSFGWGAVIFTVLMIIVGLAVGVWATGRMSTAGDPDPGTAVWDEFVGMWISALPAVLLGWAIGMWGILVAFVIFRALDVLKPWPCRRLERLHGGWGIMLDDVAAGLMALVIVSLLAVGFLWLLALGLSRGLH